MRIYTDDELAQILDKDIFHEIGNAADGLGMECYVVGGYVRDIFLERPSNDIDVVVVGSGIQVADALKKRLGRKAHISVFRNFGTAQVKYKDIEVEFVGARRESYSHDSRKPVVEDGTLEDDQNRRDFTVNAMAICLNEGRFGELVDPFDGLADLEDGILRTPLDPDITFSDDPLRMLRCVRFSAQLKFLIDEETFEALTRNAGRMSIVSGERIADELLVHADDRLAESQPEKRVARRKEPVGDLRIDAAAPESHPMFEPPGSPVGLVGMPLPGEEQDHRPGPDPLAAARTGLEIAFPARYVDQLVLLQDTPLAGVENMGFGMLRLRVGTVRRDRLVPGRRDDQPPRLVVAADVEILYVAAR